MLLTKRFIFRGLLILTGLALLPSACSGGQDSEDAETARKLDDSKSETVVIRPQEPLIAQHAEVTISLSFDRRQNLREIVVDPETAIIFYKPSDPRLVSQVLWRVECLMDGKLVSCPQEALESVAITRKPGCPDLFGAEAFKIPEKQTAVASGRARQDVYDANMEKYQANAKAMRQTMMETTREKERTAGDSLFGCNGDRLRPAPSKIDPYQGLTWQYDVTVEMGQKGRKTLDPEIWVEKDEGG